MCYTACHMGCLTEGCKLAFNNALLAEANQRHTILGMLDILSMNSTG